MRNDGDVDMDSSESVLETIYIITVYLRILLSENNNKLYIKYTLNNMIITSQAAHSYPKRM